MTDREFKQRCALEILGNPELIKMYFGKKFGTTDNLIADLPEWIDASAQAIVDRVKL